MRIELCANSSMGSVCDSPISSVVDSRSKSKRSVETGSLKKGMSWKTFRKAHWGAIAATDFFSVELITASGLVRYLVHFVIDLKTWRIEIAGSLSQPDGAWTNQIARNLPDAETGS